MSDGDVPQPLPPGQLDDGPDEMIEFDLMQLVERPRWMKRAACRGLDASLFFPERGEMVSPEARQVCAECEVRVECLHYAIAIKERDGVWGGRSGRQRRDMRAAKVDRSSDRVCIQCGVEFLGNYRSQLCSTDCRRTRYQEKKQEGGTVADQADD
jgi:hypothetical protein